MTQAQALALHQVLAGGSDVEQGVNQVVLQQVDLVDVKEAAMGAGQQPGLEGLLALGQGALQVQGADDAVLGGAQGQVDHRHWHQVALGFDPFGGLIPAVGAQAARTGLRVTAVGAAHHGAHLGQQGRQATDGGGLARTTIAEDQHPADGGVDRRHQQGLLHLVLADDGGEGKGNGHGSGVSWGGGVGG